MEKMHSYSPEISNEEPELDCCDNPNLIISPEGNLVCENCGVVYGQRFVSVERRAYTNEEMEARRRTEPCWRNYGPRTLLDPNRGDGNGSRIAGSSSRLYSRLSKIQSSLINSLERNYWESRPKLNQYALALNVPEFVVETAWKIYSIAAKRKMTMGRSIEGFVCASLYAAIRIHKFPRLLEEIAEVSMVSVRSIHKSLGLIIREILPELHLSYRPISPFHLIYRFGNDLKMDIKTQKQAVDILYNSLHNGLHRMGKDPKGIAAACLYLASKFSDDYRTQREIAYVTRITEVTLRTRAKQIYRYLNKASTPN